MWNQLEKLLTRDSLWFWLFFSAADQLYRWKEMCVQRRQIRGKHTEKVDENMMQMIVYAFLDYFFGIYEDKKGRVQNNALILPRGSYTFTLTWKGNHELHKKGSLMTCQENEKRDARDFTQSDDFLTTTWVYWRDEKVGNKKKVGQKGNPNSI